MSAHQDPGSSEPVCRTEPAPAQDRLPGPLSSGQSVPFLSVGHGTITHKTLHAHLQSHRILKISVMGILSKGSLGPPQRCFLSHHLSAGTLQAVLEDGFPRVRAPGGRNPGAVVKEILLSPGLSPEAGVPDTSPSLESTYLWFIFDTRSSLPKFHQFVTVFIVSNCP